MRKVLNHRNVVAGLFVLVALFAASVVNLAAQKVGERPPVASPSSAAASVASRLPTQTIGGEELWVAEGQLIAMTSLFKSANGSPSDQQALQGGVPGVVRNGSQHTVLLMDGRLLGKLLSDTRPETVKVFGISHDGDRAITPFRIEYRVTATAKWQVFDLPHSGTSAAGVYGGDE